MSGTGRRRPGAPALGRRPARRDERGAVTAELVMGIPILLALTIGLAWLLALGTSQVRLVDASREAARAIARGDDPAGAVALAERVAPPGSSVSVSERGDVVVVRVATEVDGPGGLFAALPGVHLDAEAEAVMEEDVGEAVW